MKDETIILNGKSLSIEDVVNVARYNMKVKIAESTLHHLKDSRGLIDSWTENDGPVYGLNRGVGLNKDRYILKDQYADYNRNLLLSHAIGIGPNVSEENVRAIMVTRLNTLLTGYTGMNPDIVKMLETFLNQHISPILPSRGTVGAGDIGILSFIGLAMIGEGEVYYQGKRISAKKALEQENIPPIILGPKDGLAIVSSNALSAGIATMLLYDLYDFIETADIIYALSLEGLHSHLSPFDESVLTARPYSGQLKSARRVKEYLANSYLWENQSLSSLQDPLSFRGGFTVHGAVIDSLHYVRSVLELQLNSSDDNPCVLADEKRILSSANYEITSVVLGLEMLCIALTHVSKNSCFRTLKLSNPSFTNLTRFLSPDQENVIAYGTIQKTFAALDAEIRHLANPVSSDYFAIAGEIEDHATNAGLVVQKLSQILENLYYIVGIEAIHAAQAVDLRNNIQLGTGTLAAYQLLRKSIPFLEKDRNLSKDIENARQLVKNKEILTAVREVFRNMTTKNTPISNG